MNMPSPRRLVPRLLLAALTLGAVASCKPEPAPPPPEPPPQKPIPPTLEQVAETIFASYFKAHPVVATTLGEHTYDPYWPDLSAAGIEAERKRIDEARALLDQVLTGAPSLDDQIDIEILRNELDLQAFVLEVEQPWTRDPYWYANLLGTGLGDLASRNFAPIADRAAATSNRLAAVPVLLEQAMANITAEQAMVPQTNVAIAQLDGLVELIRSTIPTSFAEAPEDVRATIGGASGPAIASIRAFQEFLRSQVLPTAAGPWRLGEENYARKLALTLHTDVSAQKLRRSAVVEHGRVRKQMAAIATELAPVLFNKRQLKKINRNAEGSLDRAITKAVLDELGNNHVEPAQLKDAVVANLARLSEFVNAQGLITLDDAEVLEVIWTPPHQRGVFIAGMSPPGPLDAAEGLPSFYLVQPIPESWDPEISESFLREYNNFMLEILSIHEAIPGHFVQLYKGKHDTSKVRRILQNGAFVEGWAVYTERLMVEAGYSGANPTAEERPSNISKGLWLVMTTPELRAKAIQLHGLKFYLRSVTNAILDQSIHAANMTREDALDLMIERSFQQPGEAEGKWVRAQVTSGQLSTYFVGATAWFDLRKRAEARAAESGAGFGLAEFHDAALGHGAPAVHTLPRLLGWEGDGAPIADAAAPAEGDGDAAPEEAAPEVSAEEAAAIEDELGL